MITATTAKDVASHQVEQYSKKLIDISHSIHDHPELGFQERYAAELLEATLTENGFTVEEGCCGIPTAFRARMGQGKVAFAVCAEYDALPEVGHACGHNIIAATAVGTGIALAPLLDELDIELLIIGTPAEEGGGGKITMLDRGGFAGVSAAMMVHPWSSATDRTDFTCLAVSNFEVVFSGKQAHASANPEEGINAGDALCIAQVAIGLLRQHLRPGEQVHGIVTNGGEAPNIIPGHASGHFMIRARTIEELTNLEIRIHRCFEAGAVATGSQLEIAKLSPNYSQFKVDEEMARVYRANAEALGRVFDDDPTTAPSFSTDMANVSLALPSIHPLMGISSLPALNHQPGFTEASSSKLADKAVLDGAKAMAWTIIDLSLDPEWRVSHALRDQE